MSFGPFDPSLLRRAASRLGAVARIDAVSHTQRSEPVGPARINDPRWPAFPRPDPATISIADVSQFRAIVYGAESWPGSRPTVDDFPPASAESGPLTPADRVVGTLRHLRGLHGL